MKHYYISLITLLLIVCFVGTVESVTLEMHESDKSQKPEGPTPTNYPKDKNENPYDPTTAQTFSFTLTGLAENEYYKISAVMTRSNYEGYAANFGDNTYEDLLFLRSDYVQTVTVNGKKKTTYPLGWRYKSDTRLHIEIDTEGNDLSTLGSIVVYCYDWGAI